ncbi:MAG: hypothetical protein J6Z49_05535 [Kiritimatiellae bacterium]|nr:hypothetical protein [Kiritimatiellia bacterium]
MIFGSNRRLSSAIDSNRASKAIDGIRWQSTANRNRTLLRAENENWLGISRRAVMKQIAALKSNGRLDLPAAVAGQLLYQWCWLSKYSNRESHNKQNFVKYYYTKYKNTIHVDLYDIIWYNHARRPPMEVIGYA